MRAIGAAVRVRAFDVRLPFSGDHAPDAGISARMLSVQIGPHILSKSFAFNCHKVYRHPLAAVETERSAVPPRNVVIVKILLISDLNRRVIENRTIRADARVMLEFGLKPGLFCSCHLD